MIKHKLITFENHPEFHKTIVKGIFVAAIHETKPAFACFFSSDNFTDKCTQESLLAFIERAKRGNYQIKIIGNIPFSSINNKIFESKVVIIKTVTVHGPFEILFYPKDGKLKLARLNEVKGPDKKARVLIIDDSKTIRLLLKKIFSSDPSIEIVGECADPLLAEALIKETKPNVITLDIHMPNMDGVSLLKKLLPQFDIPTIMITSASYEEGDSVLRALEEGAIDYIQKPSAEDLTKIAPLIIEKVKSAANSKVKLKSASKFPVFQAIDAKNIDYTTLIAIGSSTGGVDAIKNILTKLPKEIPPIVITQHIPAVFSKTFAERLNQICPFEVREAKDGDEVHANLVLIAPGGQQFSIEKRNGKLFAKVIDGPLVNRHKPSVDVLFASIAVALKDKAIGVILTGMGNDGSRGLFQMHQAGAFTIAQDEKSSVIFGMPKEAIKLGGVDQVISLDEIPSELITYLSNKKSA